MGNLKLYKGMILKTKEDEASRSRNNEDAGLGKGLVRVAGGGLGGWGGAPPRTAPPPICRYKHKANKQ